MSIVQKPSWQSLIDQFWQTAILRFLPDFVKPDQLTAIRLILMPVIIWLLATDHFLWGMLIFLITAILDGLDGSLARQKKIISQTGSIIDPMIDKFLYVGCLAVLLFKSAYWPLLAFTLTIDFLILAIALVIILTGHKDKLAAANALGKAKMFFQILALVAILSSLAFPATWLVTLSLIILIISILFQAGSSLNYLWKMIIK